MSEYVTRTVRVHGHFVYKDRGADKEPKQVGVNHGYVNFDELAEQIEKACNALHEEGYEVISVMPVARAGKAGIDNMNNLNISNSGYGGVTHGAVITGKRIKDQKPN